MPLTSIRAVYDGKEIRPLEPVPIETPYLVVITFIEPANKENSNEEIDRRFWGAFGTWRDSRTTDEILTDIHIGISKVAPPHL